MFTAHPTHRAVCRALPLLLVLAGLAGCETAPRETTLEVAASTQPVFLATQGDFFAGKLTASLSLTRGRPGTVMPKVKRPPREYDPVLQPHALGSSLPSAPAEDDSKLAPTLGPALTLRLRLENHSPATLTVRIPEVNSDLGNFAVRPEQLSLAPGQALETDPMISQLGVVADTIPVKVALQLAGQTEHQILTLRKPTQ